MFNHNEMSGKKLQANLSACIIELKFSQSARPLLSSSSFFIFTTRFLSLLVSFGSMQALVDNSVFGPNG